MLRGVRVSEDFPRGVHDEALHKFVGRNRALDHPPVVEEHGRAGPGRLRVALVVDRDVPAVAAKSREGLRTQLQDTCQWPNPPIGATHRLTMSR